MGWFNHQLVKLYLPRASRSSRAWPGGHGFRQFGEDEVGQKNGLKTPNSPVVGSMFDVFVFGVCFCEYALLFE